MGGCPTGPWRSYPDLRGPIHWTTLLANTSLQRPGSCLLGTKESEQREKKEVAPEGLELLWRSIFPTKDISPAIAPLIAKNSIISELRDCQVGLDVGGLTSEDRRRHARLADLVQG